MADLIIKIDKEKALKAVYFDNGIKPIKNDIRDVCFIVGKFKNTGAYGTSVANAFANFSRLPENEQALLLSGTKDRPVVNCYRKRIRISDNNEIVDIQGDQPKITEGDIVDTYSYSKSCFISGNIYCR